MKTRHQVQALLSVILLLCSLPLWAEAQEPVPSNLIRYDSPEGIALFQSSEVKQDFWALSRYFVTQKNLTYCGIASSVMVLNALNVKPPHDPAHAPYAMFTQTNIFTPAVLSVVTPGKINHEGMTLATTAHVLSQFPVNVNYFLASESHLDQFRKAVIKALQNGKQFVIVNFYRKALHEIGGGHFSPIAAYDKSSDRFLMLDVARFRYPPVWVSATTLWESMNTVDSTNHHSRGYLIASAREVVIPKTT